ncbi:hypothetical protein LWI29_031497 [Acer saccharum]|uniref:Uncharacterized protein n=1 Tax=Acer saccharum TaxID=4024 RepID=A0AA39S7S4_ACESA|nr:hypothetical protein LWI29_031497 [Acer saccharum]
MDIWSPTEEILHFPSRRLASTTAASPVVSLFLHKLMERDFISDEPTKPLASNGSTTLRPSTSMNSHIVGFRGDVEEQIVRF